MVLAKPELAAWLLLSFALLISFEVFRFRFCFVVAVVVVGFAAAHLLFSSLLFDLSLLLCILRVTHLVLSKKVKNT